jgi:hypothetical protein
MNVQDKPLIPVAYEQKTTFNSAAVNADYTLRSSAYFLLQAEGTDARWRDDGTAPTATVGMLLPAGQDFWYTGDPRKIQFIGTDAATILNITGYK